MTQAETNRTEHNVAKEFLKSFSSPQYAVRPHGEFETHYFYLDVLPLTWTFCSLHIIGDDTGIRFILQTNGFGTKELYENVAQVFPMAKIDRKFGGHPFADATICLKEMRVLVNENLWRISSDGVNHIKDELDQIIQKLYNAAVIL